MTTAISKKKYLREVAVDACRDVLRFIQPVCERVIVAGSLRRLKPMVGDVEILYIPKTAPVRDGLFEAQIISLVDGVLEEMIKQGVIEKRHNVAGSETWGPKNKLSRHVASGIPVDFFAATEKNWFNYLVCRTGPAESNTRIATLAQQKGWRWNPYGEGFSHRKTGEKFVVESEQDVFKFVGLTYKEPWNR